MSMILVLERVGQSSNKGPDAAVQQHWPTPALRLFDPENTDDSCTRLTAGGACLEVEEEGDGLSLEKAWHGLHYLLTGETWESNGPRGFLLSGGTEHQDDEEVRRLQPHEVVQIHETLQSISDEELWSGFDADEMYAHDIYPQIWDEPENDLREEYLDYFNALKEFVAMVAASGDAIDLSIG